MTLRFTKMHGLGNDFIVIDGIHQSFSLTAQQIRTLSHRHTGIGFDQCLVIEASALAEVDFNYRIFNADGHEVGQCGNGARCIARFIEHYGLSSKKLITVATPSTRMTLELHTDHTVTVSMGTPSFKPQDIPFKTQTPSPPYGIQDKNDCHQFYVVNVGNPHAVLCVKKIDEAPVTTAGKFLSTHPDFPQQANIGFMEIKNPQEILLRVYERGCGETQACGSGAVAAASIGRHYLNMAQDITVSLPGGQLLVSWPSPENDVFLRGPADFVYEGKVMA